MNVVKSTIHLKSRGPMTWQRKHKIGQKLSQRKTNFNMLHLRNEKAKEKISHVQMVRIL